MLVKDIMNNKPLNVEPGVPLNLAIPMMVEQERSCLIIVDLNQPIGIITERDITRLASRLLQDPSLIDAPVESIMTSKPLCVYENSAFKEALMMSSSHQLRHLPVVNDNYELQGVVTQDNLVDAYVRLMAEHDALESNMENLKLLSLEDPLTGVGNCRAMEVELKHCQAQSERLENNYAIALLDIDFFKKFNDYYGHQEGDEALKIVAQSTKTVLRDSDRFFRYGGEEFAIVLPNVTLDDAENIMNEIRNNFSHILHGGIAAINSTFSCGIALHKGQNSNELIELADQAMYLAKRAGRNCVKVCPARD